MAIEGKRPFVGIDAQEAKFRELVEKHGGRMRPGDAHCSELPSGHFCHLPPGHAGTQHATLNRYPDADGVHGQIAYVWFEVKP